MLRQENKRIIFLCFTFCSLLLFVGCKKYKTYNSQEIYYIRNNVVHASKSLVGEKEYVHIYQLMNDSVENWIMNKLGNYAYWHSVINYQVDSLICINKEQNKLITSILLPYVGEKGLLDDILYFYGVKINEQWCFFKGPSLALPREFYQEDIHTPLSFEKMKQIATSNIYKNYLYKNKQGEWEINENFFSDITSVAWCTDCSTQQEWDSVYIKIIQDNWKK